MPMKPIAIALALLSTTLPRAHAGTPVQPGVYSFQNRATDLLLRPKDAGRKDGNAMVLYPEYNWKCLKWDVSATNKGYILKNLFTDKTFQPSAPNPKAGTTVLQQAIDPAQNLQQWKILPSADGYVKIQLAGTQLYLMPAGENAGINTAIVLGPWQDLPAQHWKMVAKDRQSDM